MQAVPFFRTSGVRNCFNQLNKAGFKNFENIRTNLRTVLEPKFLCGTAQSEKSEPLLLMIWALLYLLVRYFAATPYLLPLYSFLWRIPQI